MSTFREKCGDLLPVVLDAAMTALRFSAVLAGGITVFLMVAPLFGYLPYSDRPGPGWYGRFPTMSLEQFAEHALNMLGHGLFLALLLPIPALMVVGIVRVCEAWFGRGGAMPAVGALVGGLVGGLWMLMAGWYISAGAPLFSLAVVLGALAGGAVAPRRVTRG